MASPSFIYEIGCGEGYWTIKILQAGYAVRGADFSRKIIDIARMNAQKARVNQDIFMVENIYDTGRKANLIMALEVLEHLEDPERALAKIYEMADPYFLCSVPDEPVWRILNFLRGKYMRDLGNTPGHLQHWNRDSFSKLLAKYFKIVEFKTPFPWLMALCSKK